METPNLEVRVVEICRTYHEEANLSITQQLQFRNHKYSNGDVVVQMDAKLVDFQITNGQLQLKLSPGLWQFICSHGVQDTELAGVTDKELRNLAREITKYAPKLEESTFEELRESRKAANEIVAGLAYYEANGDWNNS
jgi:hypothetical protein